MTDLHAMADTPRTDREVYKATERDIGFEVVNPGLCRELERALTKLQAEHEAERDAAVAEALKECEYEILEHIRGNSYTTAEALDSLLNSIRALKPDAGGKLPQSAPSSAGAELHVPTDQCGFDRNSSISEDTYVCTCGWSAAPPATQTAGMVPEPCPDCGGNGYGPDRAYGPEVYQDKCETCNGSGLATAKEG